MFAYLARAASSSSDEETPPAEPAPTTRVLDPDSKYFKGVSDEVKKILQKEKIQERYKKVLCVCWSGCLRVLGIAV